MFKTLMAFVDKKISDRIDETSDDPFAIGLLHKNAEKFGRKSDYQKAGFYFSKASAAGDVRGTFELGLMYFEGKGTEVNPKAGFALVSAAANQGYSKAQCYLGQIYAGHDTQAAIAWFEKAAAQGDNFATQRAADLRKRGT